MKNPKEIGINEPSDEACSFRPPKESYVIRTPKPVYDETWAQGRGSSLFHPSLKPDKYPSTKEVFKTLEDAGIKPCFLKDELQN